VQTQNPFSPSLSPLTCRQGGKTYDKWTAYGQSKTANMLMAISLAEKAGPRGLLAFSVHPGLIMATGLGAHLDFSGSANDDMQGIRK
jgi:NAD(P)-dependent dehydrogenase (short-subunit alcohol dehydrogenase family)